MRINFTRLAGLCLFAFLYSEQVTAQKLFSKGFLISANKDTIAGLIDNQNWDQNPTVINFKKDSGAGQESFMVHQLQGFGILNGDVYHKAIVQMDKTPTRFEKLLNSPKSVIETDTVFLLSLVKGAVNLYHILDENDKNHFYIQKDNGPLDELIQRNYLAYQNEQPMLGVADKYKDQLKYQYLTDCSTVQTQIGRTAYTKGALIALFEKYNACINPESKPQTKSIDKHESKFGMVAGINATNYNFNGKSYDYLTKTKFDWQPNPMIGFFYQLVLPRNRHKYSIYNEVAWKKNYTQGNYNINEIDYKGKGTLTIRANYIGLTSLLRYACVNQNWQPFINAGLAGNFATNITTRLQSLEKYGASEETTERNILDKPGKFEIAAVAGVGVKRIRMATEVRLERGNGYLNPYVEISGRKTMLMFLINYSFN